MTEAKYFHGSHIYRTRNIDPRNTDIPDEAWYLPISTEYAKNIQKLLVKLETEWMAELQQQFNQLLMYDPELVEDFPIPPSPLRYSEAVAYQILRQDFRLLEVEAAALGFALIPVNQIHLFDSTQVRLMSNTNRLMDILNAYGSAEKVGG